MRRLIVAFAVLLFAAYADAGMIIRGSGGGGGAPTSISHGNDSYGQNASSATSYTLAHNLSAASGNNRLLVVGVSLDLTTGPPTLSCTYNGTAMTALTAAYINGMQVRLFYLLDADLPASAGSYNIVASTTAAGYLKIIASDFTGVDQAAADMEDTATASSATSLTTEPDPVVANSLTWDMKANSSSSQDWNSHDADYTQIAELEGGSAHASTASYRIHAGTSLDAITDSGTQSANIAGACAVFAPAGS